MSQKTRYTKSALAVAVALVSTQAWSAGFQLNEFSSSGLGRAYSGEGAIADDAGNASRNPALIMMFDRPAFSAGAVYIDPDVNITGKSPATGRSTDADNIAPTAWVPNAHFVMPINEQFGWGASVTSNYGLATEFNNNYAAGMYGGKTDLQTVNLNLSGAYRLSSNWSFGLGFDAVYAKAKIERYAGETSLMFPGATGKAVGITGADSQVAHLKGDEWGYGWNAGILYELDKNNRWGLTYRSEVKIDFDGDYKSSITTRGNQLFAARGITGLPYGTDGRTIGGSLTLNLPEMWEISGYNRIAPQWAIHYSMAYTSWSQFQELKATGSNGQELFYKDESFKDAYRIALGTTYYYDKNWTFRTGIAFDDSPVPANHRSISIPDQDRFWLSAGTTYAFNDDASIDVGASYMHGQSVTVQEGNYTFKSEGKAWLFGTNFNYRF
ncbi:MULTISPECIES: long-chain fatty acid transporter FadL [Enterobacteriaceae]|nr:MULTISPECIES: long-chain fatty acid transporter FadL [Enterobacteriaceae]HAT3916660.1 long-chain fatty acid transporter FadL [Kluyvera ascorbata]BBQ82909.1 long-chain fatty acid transporter [Klebsiella sp. WP3-W18-ESBL-02]BBR19943.1 long-chain fatty acid transporter [Klebsiella sp. WP3-S18-ESBL-05]BBR59825.1 long-chain fatty acid transporter [Klebsiella sp. WP4-W18-ESBL-05]BBS90839.1 long-chain fatty acid transporter [Klebsiella sp. WP7-S18-CRE-02]